MGIYHNVEMYRKTSSAPVYFYRMSLCAGLNLLKLRMNQINEPGKFGNNIVGTKRKEIDKYPSSEFILSFWYSYNSIE